MKHAAFKSIFVGGGSAQLIIALSGLILARTFSPADFSKLALISSIATLASTVSALRFDHLAFRSKGKDEQNAYGTIGLTCATISAFLVGATYLILQHFKIIRSETSAAEILYFTLGVSIYHQITQYQLYTRNYSGFAKSRLAQALFYGSIPLIFQFINQDDALTTGILLSFILSSVISLYSVRKYFQWMSTYAVILFKEKFRSAVSNSCASLLQYSTPFAPVIIGGAFASNEEIGGYFLFSQMVAAPFSLARRSIINLYNAEYSNIEEVKIILTSKNRKKILTLLISIFSAFLFILILIHLFGRLIIINTIGEQWAGLAFMLTPIVFYYFADCLLQPITTLLPHWGATKYLLALESIRFSLVYPVGLFISYVANFNFFSYLLFFFGTMIAIYMAEFIVALIYLKKK